MYSAESYCLESALTQKRTRKVEFLFIDSDFQKSKQIQTRCEFRHFKKKIFFTNGRIMSQKRSPIWLYFEEHSSKKRFAVCTICKSLVTRGSEIPSKQTTKALWDHLKKHPKEEKIVSDVKAKNASVPTASIDGANAGSSIDNGRIDEVKALKTKKERHDAFQKTIPDWTESKTKLPFNSPKAQAFHKSVFEFMILDNQPFSIVNNRGFLRHHQMIAPNFELASDKYYRSLLEPTFNKVKEALMKTLFHDNPGTFVVSLDGWTAHHIGYIGINGHYLKDWKRIIFHIDCQPFDKSHSAVNIRDCMEEHLRE